MSRGEPSHPYPHADAEKKGAPGSRHKDNLLDESTDAPSRSDESSGEDAAGVKTVEE